MRDRDVFKKVFLSGFLVFFIICIFQICLPASSRADSITLQWNWDRPPDPGIAGYKIYYCVDSPGGPYNGTGIDQGDSGHISITAAEISVTPEIILTGLDTQKHIYYFVITAYSEGGLESDYSNEVSTLGTAGTKVDPIKISGKTEYESGSSGSTFTGTGGSAPGTYVWTSSNTSAGTINAATGAFTPATVTSGIQTTIIRATDPNFSYIFAEVNVTVFSPIRITSAPADYDADNLQMTPLIKGAGTTYAVTAEGGLGDYSWSIMDGSGTVVAGTITGNTYTVVADDLFNHSGAGVYTVAVTCPNAATAAELKIRIPLRISPLTGFHLDSGTTNFVVSGHPAPYQLNWSVTDEEGQEIVNPDFVTFQAVTTVDPGVNNFNFQPISYLTLFRVRARSTDTTLSKNGLDTVISDIQTITPVLDFALQVNDADTHEPIRNAVITLTNDNSKTTYTNELGQAIIAGMRNTGVTYTFEVTAVDYTPTTFSTNDVSQIYTVSLIGTTPGYQGTISGTVSLNGVAGGSGILVSFYGQDSPVVLADPDTGAYSLNFDTSVEGDGPYTIVARKTGYVTDVDDDQGMISADDGDTGADIDLLPKTKITITDDGGYPTLTFTITAGPIVFNGTPGEIRVFEGTDIWGRNVTDNPALSFSGGTYQFSVLAPGSGDSAGIYVEADTVSRSAGSGYFAYASHVVLGAMNPTFDQSVDMDDPQAGGSITTPTGSVTAIVPPGGVDTHNSITLSLSEYSALPTTPESSNFFQIKLFYTDSGETVPNNLISRIYFTVFNPSGAQQGSLEFGQMLIYQAENLKAMADGNVTSVPENQILFTNYVTGEDSFWVDHLSVFGMGSLAGDNEPEGSGCFINTTTERKAKSKKLGSWEARKPGS